MTVTTSSQVNGDSSVREKVSSYPTLWGRELVSADRVETPPPFRGDTGWLTPHRFRRTSRDAPNFFLTGWLRLSVGEVDVVVRKHLEQVVQVGKGTACRIGA